MKGTVSRVNVQLVHRCVVVGARLPQVHKAWFWVGARMPSYGPLFVLTLQLLLALRWRWLSIRGQSAPNSQMCVLNVHRCVVPGRQL